MIGKCFKFDDRNNHTCTRVIGKLETALSGKTSWVTEVVHWIGKVDDKDYGPPPSLPRYVCFLRALTQDELNYLLEDCTSTISEQEWWTVFNKFKNNREVWRNHCNLQGVIRDSEDVVQEALDRSVIEQL